MRNMGLLLFGYAVLVPTAGCVAESADDGNEHTQASELEAIQGPAAGITDAIGAFHLIRVANSQFCLQPKGESTGSVPIELHTCDPLAPAQNWLRIPHAGGNELVNLLSGKCIYYGGAENPQINGSKPILATDCNIFGSTNIASNAIWRLDHATGFTVFESKLRDRDTNFCLDLPDGNPFDGAALQIWRCNREPQQQFKIGVE